MSRLNIRSTCNALVAAPLILSLLVRVMFADGLLLHDHSDHGIHTHAVGIDDVREGDLHVAWHRYHDDIHDDDRDDRHNDSGGSEYADSLLIFVSDPATATGLHCSSGAVIASVQPPSSKALPQSMLPSDSTDASRFLTASWPSAHPLRPVCALAALLQSSHALLL